MIDRAPRAVVFAYHNVGVRGLAALLAQGVEVMLVVTHTDNPNENIWFDSVAELARLNNIPIITPDDPNSAAVIDQVRACQPDWLFSFYYRHMLGTVLLDLPAKGAYNLHGSLLPKYRGRVPVNWAVIKGERETGASLHRMEIKPDAGALVDQEPVAILANDTAHEVFQKVTWATEKLLLRCLPGLLSGTIRETPLNLAAGSYFGGRRPEDGGVDWTASAWEIHNLIRAVAPPYPGAFTDIGGNRLQLLGSYYRDEAARETKTRLYWQDGRCWADCCDGKRLCLTTVAIDGQQLDIESFRRHFGTVELAIC
ncbi:MAG: formyltransferase [Gammaproteobacteria bacterium]|nr:formyltransferase [Gammaproteobacteria bacterium]